ncbi:MAG: vitamin B12-dependent ribonucleotide reductase, partial [candidate division KSB1 bacterium]|nr:vitamin B12-dependent ribonucleotide reductase [candidate division KSB1 bacterium]
MAHEQELNFSDGNASTLTTQHKSESNGENGNGGSKGIHITPFFTKDNAHPFDVINWVKRHAVITNENGENVFEQEDVEFPDNWSQTAVNVVTSKYFHGKLGTPEREHSVKQLIGRVAKTIAEWGLKDGYFATKDTSDIYLRELTHLLVNQKASFNSPVWFNCGIEIEPQCSACFINAIDDSMESILDLAKIEGMLFKFGSGAGVNLSPLRSSREKLSTGGISSGPLSFMKGYDSFAGAIKSGGKTRRAAKMVILNADHPDIAEFINAKSEEEQKAWALIDSGYDGSFDGEAYSSVFFQNANHSVRVSDEFMQSVIDDAEWATKEVLTGDDFETHKARDIMNQIVNAAHLCGDPGLQFDTTINDWHTCSISGKINASNPCSEYMFLDNTACNLASLNLMKFRNEDGTFNTDAFVHAVRIMIIAQDIIVHNASYPTKEINDNSHAYRTLGLGYANLGAILMANGLPYDSDEGRSYAAAVSALMTGQAYRTSAEISEKLSPYPEYGKNKKPMLRVIEKHLSAATDIPKNSMTESLAETGIKVWQEALEAGKKHGYRNAQTTVLAPTGTIGFMMDCDTTGIEPDIALLKYKHLVGGGTMKLVNSTISEALKRLGYTHEQSVEIMNHLNEKDTIEGAPHLLEKHLPVFDCAFKPTKGTRAIHYMGHIRMMAAVQPFISGAISKTVNMPNASTPSDIYEAYVEAWKLK